MHNFSSPYSIPLAKELLLTWGVDGRVCVWDSFSIGEVTSPLCTLLSRKDYPIYTLDIHEEGAAAAVQAGDRACIAVGGGAEGGFLGVPAYLYGV